MADDINVETVRLRYNLSRFIKLRPKRVPMIVQHTILTSDLETTQLLRSASSKAPSASVFRTT
ncbi:hypothetical protein T265_16278, partial [Opisthorchis viverrini]